jgi:transposase-like protein
MPRKYIKKADRVAKAAVEDAEVVKDFPAPVVDSPRVDGPERPSAGSGACWQRTREFLDGFGEDPMIEVIEAGATLSELANDLGVTNTALRGWIDAKESRRIKFNRARAISAEAKEVEAYTVLHELTAASTNAEVARAKELANQCRWQAQMRDPDRYGEKRQLTVKHEVAQLSDAELQAETQRLLAAMANAEKPVGAVH